MKAMSRNPALASKARRAEAKRDGLISIKTPASTTTKSATGGKKSGFKNAFVEVGEDKKAEVPEETKVKGAEEEGWEILESVEGKDEDGNQGDEVGGGEEEEGWWSDEEEGRYDPGKAVGCGADCPCGG